MIKDAIFDDSEMYRYSLTRVWSNNQNKVLFVMLNPSTADHNVDDPTIRRCINFAKNWGVGSLEVVNLFGYRATDPDELKKAADPIGPDNDIHIQRAALQSDKIILAWGTKEYLLGRNKKVMEDVLFSYKTHCLDISKNGHPKHPLYISANREPIMIR